MKLSTFTIADKTFFLSRAVLLSLLQIILLLSGNNYNEHINPKGKQRRIKYFLLRVENILLYVCWTKIPELPDFSNLTETNDVNTYFAQHFPIIYQYRNIVHAPRAIFLYVVEEIRCCNDMKCIGSATIRHFWFPDEVQYLYFCCVCVPAKFENAD